MFSRLTTISLILSLPLAACDSDTNSGKASDSTEGTAANANDESGSEGADEESMSGDPDTKNEEDSNEPSGETESADSADEEDSDSGEDSEEKSGERMGEDPNPNNGPDSDGDRLSDEEEARRGTDPNNVDSDNDGYLDGWEVMEGTDPLDPASRIYTGGWPYNPDKDELETIDKADATMAFGAYVPRTTNFRDQYGDKFDLFDYAQSGAPILIDLSSPGCGPCHSLSSYLSGLSDQGWSDIFPTVPEKINNGTVHWITIITDNGGMDFPSIQNAEAWHEYYPHEHIPVLADFGQEFSLPYLNGWPTLFLIDSSTMQIEITPEPGNGYAAVYHIENNL